MAMMDSREAIFTIELPDGRVYTGSAMTVSISGERSVGDVYLFEDGGICGSSLRTWEIELRGIGPLSAAESGKFIEYLEAGSRALEESEWECPYCGRSWPHSQRMCWDGVNGCGANRPAMWWI